MDRVRSLAMVAGTVAIVFAAGQYMQADSTRSDVTAAQTPVAETVVVALRRAAGTPLQGYEFPDVTVTRAETVPEPVVLPAQDPVADEACPVTLDLFADAEATLSLSLAAPCHPNEGVVLRHAGLSVTYSTTATGSLFLDIPALDPSGEVTLRFLDGTEVSGAAPVPELAGLRRFALQWIEGDSFNLASDAEIISLGTAATALPMYAQIATLPSEDTTLAIEAPVTATACGRDALGEALFSEGGKLTVAELTMALPDCDAEGGFVVLNNPVADMKLVAAR